MTVIRFTGRQTVHGRYKDDHYRHWKTLCGLNAEYDSMRTFKPITCKNCLRAKGR